MSFIHVIHSTKLCKTFDNRMIIIIQLMDQLIDKMFKNIEIKSISIRNIKLRTKT